MKALLAQLLGTKTIEEFLHKPKQGLMMNPMIDGSEFNAYCDVMWRALRDEEWRLKEQEKNIQRKLIQLQLGELRSRNKVQTQAAIVATSKGDTGDASGWRCGGGPSPDNVKVVAYYSVIFVDDGES
ncbi:Hypothetical predicted protein [Xyrichtys novacula]|uniref:Uncharacterized protein n=1 Tax=Xyrichtys novacula TaxID=13765 RepID=A0AAV1H960_XYRNO|nr:Hypothetical predicted protein [Xyrichtys novacula]